MQTVVELGATDSLQTTRTAATMGIAASLNGRLARLHAPPGLAFLVVIVAEP